MRHRPFLLFMLVASTGCTESFDAVTAWDDMFADETGDASPSDDDGSPGSGWHTVTSNASNSGGGLDDPENEGSSASGTTGATDEPPVLSLLRVNGANVPETMTAAGPITLSLNAYDDHGIVAVQLWSSDSENAPLVILPGHDDALYEHALSVDHQDDAGEYTFWAVALDDAGQTSETAKVSLSVELPESGTEMWNYPTGPHDPDESIVWQDAAALPDGDWIVVGFRQHKGEQPWLLVARRSAEGEPVEDGVITPVQGMAGTAIAVAEDGTLFATALVDKVDTWVGRFTLDGEILHETVNAGAQWRDVAIVGDRYLVTGNVGEELLGDTKARTRGLTSTLEPYWSRTEYGDGSTNVARSMVTLPTRVFVGGYVTDGAEVPHAAVWAYNRGDGAPVWDVTFDEMNEEIHAITLTDSNRLVAVGSINEGVDRMRVRELSLSGEPVSDITLLDTVGDATAAAVAPSSHGEFILGGQRCDGGCYALSRRYGTGSLYLWEQEQGVTEGSRVVSAESLDHGYTLLLGSHAINYGQGPVLTSWMRVVHP